VSRVSFPKLGEVVNARYSFRLKSEDKSSDLPDKVIIGQSGTETTTHVLLKFLGFVLFHRERLQVETNLHLDHIPFRPDLVQLDYEMRPRLWVECGDCSVAKLNKLAVKVPEAEIWTIKRSLAEVEHLHRAMAKEELRRNRYQLIGLDEAMFTELDQLLRERNELTLFRRSFDPPQLQFDFNGLWFDAEFTILHF